MCLLLVEGGFLNSSVIEEFEGGLFGKWPNMLIHDKIKLIMRKNSTMQSTTFILHTE